MKRIITIALISVFLIALFGACSPRTSQTPVTPGITAQRPGTLSDEIITVALPSEPGLMIPNIHFTPNPVNTINLLVFEPLIASDRRTLQPLETALISNVEQIDDLHFRFTLRQGVRFHNGEEFTTADVQYMFEEGRKGANNGSRYFIFEPDRFVIEDRYNIIVALNQPWAQGIELLGFEQCLVMSANALREVGGAATSERILLNAGTGKYKFREWVPGRYIEVERNNDYWDKDNMGYFAGIRFVFITDTSARGMAVQSGDVDIALGLDLANYMIYDADPNVKTVPLEVGNISVLFLNSGTGGPFADIRVRQAVEALIDKTAINQIGHSGFGMIGDTIISPLSPMWDGVPVVVTPPDINRARRLLAEAGYPDGLTVRMRVSGSISATATMIQEMLRLGGITVEMVLAEQAVHFEGLRTGDFDMYQSSQQSAYYTEPIRCLDGINYSFRDVSGGAGYQGREFSAMAVRAYTSFDMNARRQAYADIQRYFRANTLSIGLHTLISLDLARPDIEGIELIGIGSTNIANIYSTR